MNATEAAAKIREALARFSPVWVSPPVLQPVRFYLEWLGEDLRARAFLTQSEDGHDLCLRPDMTAPACRIALAHHVVPWAVAYEGQVFRRQNAGSQKEQEFVQVGLECLATPPGEADLIAASLEAARACGADPSLRLGHTKVMDALLAGLGLHPLWAARLKAQIRRGAPLRADAPATSAQALTRALAGLAPDDAGAALSALYEAAGITAVGARPPAAIARRLQEKAALAQAPAPTADQMTLLSQALTVDGPVDEAVKALAGLIRNKAVADRAPAQAALDAVAEQWQALIGLVKPPLTRFAPGFGRALSIYDGFVFELEAPALGERASLGGGGRYDALVQAVARDLGRADASSLRASGFALRPARLAEAAQ